MQPVSSFSHGEGARGVVPCCRIVKLLEYSSTSKMGDKMPLLQLMRVVTSCRNTGWGQGQSLIWFYQLITTTNITWTGLIIGSHVQAWLRMWDGENKPIECGSLPGGLSGRELRVSRFESLSRKAVRGAGEAVQCWEKFAVLSQNVRPRNNTDNAQHLERGSHLPALLPLPVTSHIDYFSA